MQSGLCQGFIAAVCSLSHYVCRSLAISNDMQPLLRASNKPNDQRKTLGKTKVSTGTQTSARQALQRQRHSVAQAGVRAYDIKKNEQNVQILTHLIKKMLLQGTQSSETKPLKAPSTVQCGKTACCNVVARHCLATHEWVGCGSVLGPIILLMHMKLRCATGISMWALNVMKYVLPIAICVRTGGRSIVAEKFSTTRFSVDAVQIPITTTLSFSL